MSYGRLGQTDKLMCSAGAATGWRVATFRHAVQVQFLMIPKQTLNTVLTLVWDSSTVGSRQEIRAERSAGLVGTYAYRKGVVNA
ncbi:MAG: hypothetical protein EHM48_03320 [Planctomycetaceae bacterium]|nr:MAG: hypothetical protein EHM48_03320 [Planctomycetaceae bacterium]